MKVTNLQLLKVAVEVDFSRAPGTRCRRPLRDIWIPSHAYHQFVYTYSSRVVFGRLMSRSLAISLLLNPATDYGDS